MSFNGILNRNTAGKSQQLQVHHQQEIGTREKERLATQERIEYARMMCQKMQQRESLSFQAEQREADREFQAELAELNREFQAQENSLNRQHQLTLLELNQEFQHQEGEISRAFAEKIELFRADLQKYFFEQQRELQIQLKTQDIELARELRLFDRQTAISVVQEQKRQNNSPIWLVLEDLISRGEQGDVLPLRIFFSPPDLKYDRSKEASDHKGFPQIEQYLTEKLQQFFQKYDDHGRKTDYLAGAWTSKQFGNKAAARQIFLGLKSEPTLILESTLESGNLSISFGYWALGYVNEHYRTMMSFPWLETLYGFVKERTEEWFRLRLEQGTSEADWVAEYGEEFVAKYQSNRAMMEREKRWLESGEDIRELNRNYYIAPRDWDELKRFVAVCHCVVAGWVADEYFLVDVSPVHQQEPLLPALLPELLQGFSADIQQMFIEHSVQLYQGLYQGLINEMPNWEPELRLKLATSLIKLSQPAAGMAEINGGLRVWLASRGVVWDGTGEVLPLLAQVATPDDKSYFHQLYEVWKAVGITDEVNMAAAYYRRGENLFRQRDYDGAIADFDRALAYDLQIIKSTVLIYNILIIILKDCSFMLNPKLKLKTVTIFINLLYTLKIVKIEVFTILQKSFADCCEQKTFTFSVAPLNLFR